MVNSPDSMISRSCHTYNETKPLYGLQHAERCISYLTTHPGSLLCLSLWVVFLPHWPAFCTLPTSSSSCFGDPCACSSFCLVWFFSWSHFIVWICTQVSVENILLKIAPSKLCPIESIESWQYYPTYYLQSTNLTVVI